MGAGVAFDGRRPGARSRITGFERGLSTTVTFARLPNPPGGAEGGKVMSEIGALPVAGVSSPGSMRDTACRMGSVGGAEPPIGDKPLKNGESIATVALSGF